MFIKIYVTICFVLIVYAAYNAIKCIIEDIKEFLKKEIEKENG